MYVCKYSLLIPLNQRDIILIPLEANHKKKKQNPKPQTSSVMETWLLSFHYFQNFKVFLLTLLF